MPEPPSLDEIRIRALGADDAPALFAAVRDSLASLSYWFTWCSADYSLADAKARVAQCAALWERDEGCVFGIFGGSDLALLGCVGLNDIRPDGRRDANGKASSANLGYWVGEAHRGHGVASTAAAMAAAYGFDILGLSRIEIATLPHNEASQRVAEKLGAVRDPGSRRSLDFQGENVDAVVYSLSAHSIALPL